MNLRKTVRYFAIIFSIIHIVSQAQLSAPKIRCLEVLANGDVKVNWIVPSEPNQQFFTYEIYTSPTKSGPYTLVPTNITSISTNTFLHSSTSATNSGIYYFMRTLYGTNGINKSNNSDTLRTLFLSVLPSSVAKEIRYNALHQPGLASSSKNYIIEKEYPLGTWQAIKITENLNYFDTINVCRAQINYKVRLTDASGCESVSNIQGGVYNDTKSPEEPLIDSISVLPDGKTILAWKVPIDKDVVKYEIQYRTSAGTNTVMDVASGRTTTAYTYTLTAANITSVGIFAGAIDSCNRSSTLNYNLNTMFLKTEYNRCSHTTTLSWNNYLFIQNGILEYRIYYSTDSLNFKLLGSSTQNSFVHTNVDGGKRVCYFVRVINNPKLITASSNRVYFFTSEVQIPDYTYIKNVKAINDNSNSIQILIDASKESKGLSIQRSEDSLNFTTIGFLNYIGSPNFNFVDELVTPKKKSYYYRAVITDSCGNSRTSSNVVKTMLLESKDDQEDMFTKHLTWNAYEGFNAGVGSYKIYRAIDGTFESSPITTTKPNVRTYSDNIENLAEQGARVDYFIEANEKSLNAFGIQENSTSNSTSVFLEGRLYVPNAFAPKGVNKTWKPILHFIDKNEYSVKVFNRWGLQVFETNNDADVWNGDEQPADVYVYIIHYKNARGEYKEVTGKLNLIR